MKPLFTLLLLFCFLLGSTAVASDDRWQTRGKAAEFTFREYAPLSNKPVVVRYYIPSIGNIENMPVLMIAHGMGREASISMGGWIGFAERDGIILIAPEFALDVYSVNDFQRGNIYERGNLVPRERWTGNIVEAVFDDLKKNTGNKAKTYDIYGHSAGAQFVHRMLLTMPEVRVGTAIAANSGNYTFPLMTGISDEAGEVYGWAFSVKNTPFGTEEYLKAFFAKNMIILSGTADTLSDTDNFLRTGGAMAQGGTRVERAYNFYNASKQVAKEIGLPFNWKIVDVEGIGHHSVGMIHGAYVNVAERTVSADHWTPASAYGQLFGNQQSNQK
jgi:poly(3-hydroxybutyrate) depolymerase